MKKYISHFLTTCFLVVLTFSVKAQEDKLSETFKKKTISHLSDMINDYYVFPEVAKKTSAHLQQKLSSGHFNQFTDLETFAEALTTEVQSINKDKHMRIRPLPPFKAEENTPERMIEERLRSMERSRNNTAGFQEVKKLEGNVGYLDLRGFASPDIGSPIADSYMNLLATSDAVIIDLRKNGGGSPHMVQYLCSYFFDKKIHLNSLYWREGDRTTEFWTLDEVGGTKMPDIPLFVLTSDRTFSGAEEFSYNMQTQKRATLVGQTTGGGANPGGFSKINSKLGVFIPSGKAINPITKTNWEGVGVIPEVKTSPEETMDKAHKLAKAAAEVYRAETNKKNKAFFTDLQNQLENYSSSDSETSIITSLKKCHDAGLFGEGDINGLGYEYLMNYKKPKTAEVIFKTNTILFPDAANTYDSYGEALAMNGKYKESVASYQKAIKLGKQNKDPNLQLFIENLEKVKSKMDKKS